MASTLRAGGWLCKMQHFAGDARLETGSNGQRVEFMGVQYQKEAVLRLGQLAVQSGDMPPAMLAELQNPHSRTRQATVNLPFTFPPALDAADEMLNRSMQERDEPFASAGEAEAYFRLKCADKLCALRDLTDAEIAEACRLDKEQRQTALNLEKAAGFAEAALRALRAEERARAAEEEAQAARIRSEQEEVSARFTAEFQSGGTQEAAESKAARKKAKKTAVAATAGGDSDEQELRARREGTFVRGALVEVLAGHPYP